MKGYKTLKEDRIQVYNDWYKNKIKKLYFKKLCKMFFKNDAELKLDILKKDIDTLDLDYTGQQFIDKLIQKMNLTFNSNNNGKKNNTNFNNKNKKK